MTALWTSGNGFGDGYESGNGFGDGFSHGWGNGDGWGNEYGDGYGNNRGGGIGDGYESGNGFGDGDRDGDGNGWSNGFPEQSYDGCTAIGRSRIYEAQLPVADLLALAVTR